ncbi:MAG: ABC transporter substrate-binding protein [Prevotellaceae bacterium]|nr:ABC transporter substrate-binding protein [Prevotellaceae bacterium]
MTARISTCCSSLCLLLWIACVSPACSGGGERRPPAGADTSAVEPRHALGFSIARRGDALLLKVKNPWQYASDVEFEYLLTPAASPDNPREIKTPATRVVCMSTTHIAFISALGETSTIKGVSGLRHVSDTLVRAAAARGETLETGYDANLSYETIYSLKPDVLFAYGVAGEFVPIEKKLNEIGIKVVYIGEYLEETPLGKAEWLIAVAAFFGRMKEAAAIFDRIEADYEQVGKSARGCPTKPSVMINLPYKDVWYMPGMKNYMVKFIEDAGAKYVYPQNNRRESVPVSAEKAFALAWKADFWLIGNASASLDEMKAFDSRIAGVPAFKRKKIYNRNLRANGFGDDFWESGIVKPEVILKDLIKIFHPDLLPEHESYFYRHLE